MATPESPRPATRPDDRDLTPAPTGSDEDAQRADIEESSELVEDGYDDRQESKESADRDLLRRKQTDPDARYRDEQHPLSEPRKAEEE